MMIEIAQKTTTTFETIGFNFGYNIVDLLINCLNSRKNKVVVYKDDRFTFETLTKKDIGLLKSIYLDPDANATVVPITKPTQEGVEKKLQTFPRPVFRSPPLNNLPTAVFSANPASLQCSSAQLWGSPLL